MSWFKTYESREAFENDEALISGGISSPVPSHLSEQIAAARTAAEILMVCGVVGSDDKDFAININGHSNPKHEPHSGWSNDFITVTISQKVERREK